MADSAEIFAAVERELPGVRETLAELIRIPSISSDPDHVADVRASAEFVARQLREVGCPEVEIISEGGGKPAVLGRFPAPAGQPTITLYSHHDVQPTGLEESWTSAPFDPTQRGERLFARGAADDKGGIGVHLAALRAWAGKPPIGVTVFIEGEEEIGSPTLDQILDKHGDKLACDVFLICDSGNWQVGTPAFTTSLRGMGDITVEVATLDHAVHSGQYGGVAPDALMTLVRLLATLHDDRGRVAVAGLTSSAGPELDYSEERVREEIGVLDGVELIGDGSLTDRMWMKPSLSIIGIDTTSVAKASNTLIPSARAKMSLRIAPGQSAPEAMQLVADHLRAHAPWGARVTVTLGDYGNPFVTPLTGPYAGTARQVWAEAWGVEPVEMGLGGSIPLAQDFADRFPAATVLLTAVVDPDSRMHGIDESLHLGDFARACRAEALLLGRLAR
ncbi:dipeptidase [Granulicoccus phenolivorans]|uniref:dipeptidase n=1 Tax=Granulicoccus phenolivorans TaxID=266854 RepID=UPI0003F6F2B6|nr:dipeptidase [Granulicoccus phenolivorans]